MSEIHISRRNVRSCRMTQSVPIRPELAEKGGEQESCVEVDAAKEKKENFLALPEKFPTGL